MWHYTEGIQNWNPRSGRTTASASCQGPSSLWLDARNRLPVPLFPGFDTLGTLEHIMKTGYEYTWFVLDQKIIGKEFALSGSEQNPDLTGKSIRDVIGRARADVPGPVKAFMDNGADFVVEKDLGALVRGINTLTEEPLIDEAALRREIVARDREIAEPLHQGPPGDVDPRRPQLPRGQADPYGHPAPHPGPQGGSAHRRPPPRPHPQEPGRAEPSLSSRVLEGGDPLSGVYAAGEAARSAVAESTATAPWRAPSSGAASSPAAQRAERPPRR